MAVQLQVAFSQSTLGVGVVAGGPYGCADGNVYRAVRVCMNAFWGTADAADSVTKINEHAANGHIDDPTHMEADRIYLFHGTADDTVARASMDALRQTYASLNVPDNQVDFVTDVPAGHGFVTQRGELSCNATGPDFLIDCDFDQAGDILGHLYPDLAPPTEPNEAGILPFNQAQYTQGASGMDAKAFVYIRKPVPPAHLAVCTLHYMAASKAAAGSKTPTCD